jgi:prepilin-type N-terminal cleavage/methylation domain-containing protein
MNKSNFTLIEVVVALGILAVGIGGMLQLAVSSQLRVANAVEKWEQVHVITQAAEYLMLMDEETTEIPEEYFPYENYTINAYNDDSDDLPEEFNGIEGQLPLKKLVIELTRESDGKVVETVIIDRLSYEEEPDYV